MFEKLEPSLELKRLIYKYKDEPRGPSMKDLAKHWTVVLGKDKDFFFDTLKMKVVPEDIAEKYHNLWESLRASGWRRIQDRDSMWHWACTYQHLVQKKTDRVFSEADQERYEDEYYDDVFTKEGDK